MWPTGWRNKLWDNPNKDWDIIIIGGGITGAGILREAVHAGLNTILFEAHDFASGTSSRSSKLVHGGLRYLRTAQFGMTYHSVHERERLLKQGRGLIVPLPFLMANYAEDSIPPWIFGIGLSLYDLMAKKWNHRHYSPEALLNLCPQLSDQNLVGGFRYFDAVTDDARLVLRLIKEAVQDGGHAFNYARVEGLLKLQNGRVCGVAVSDLSPEGLGRTMEIRGKVVINATGAWADQLRKKVGGQSRLRTLRGSHLVFPYSKLPLTRAVTFLHPMDGRPVFIFPWEGTTVVGTTDVDHQDEIFTNISISQSEEEYLLASLHYAFSDAGLSLENALSTYSGIRAVVDTGKSNPSKESREHILWKENGLLSITGGKLTTFRIMAQTVLRTIRKDINGDKKIKISHRVLDPLPMESATCGNLTPQSRLRLSGRYGNEICTLVAHSNPGELNQIMNIPTLWAELRWAARSEGVIHLDDLLIRRVRIGLLLPNGGIDLMPHIREIVQPELGWDDFRWEQEVTTYKSVWKQYFSPV